MNKNSKSRLKFRRQATVDQMSPAKNGRMIISCNNPTVAHRRYEHGAQVVYHNVGSDGKKTSITRHEAIVANSYRVTCRSKVGGKSH